MTNRSLYLIPGSVAGLLLGVCPVGTVAAQAQRPNIIFILADDLGYADITPFGQEIIRTPNLERLAAQGKLFTQAYAGTTVSAPSRASLMTGMHTGHTFVRGNKEIKPEGQCAMPAGTFTLGTLFKQQGYATGAFGKWGLGYPGSESIPSEAGFDRFYGYNCQRMAHSYYPDHLWSDNNRVEFPENINPGRTTYSQDLIHEQGMAWIDSHCDGPFFAYMAYTLPHAELNLPHDEVYDYYVNKIGAENDKAFTSGGYHDSDHPLASFAAMVERLDSYVGDIMALVEKKGIADNTIIIFTSDNGPHREGGANPDFFDSYGPLRGVKRDLYEGGIRVPMIASWPGHIDGGSVSDQKVAFWDMMPTFAQLIGSQTKFDTDGISIAPTLTGKGRQKQHPYLYWEFHELGGRQAVRMGDWKGVRLKVGDPDKTVFELYNLADDLHEDHNVAAENPKISSKIQQLMDTAHTHSDLFDFGREK